MTAPVTGQLRDRTALPASPGLSRLDHVFLKDRTEVGIRLLEPADREALIDLYGRLSAHSRYQRFFARPAQLPAPWADALLDLSPGRRLGLAAELLGEPGRIVAFADYTVSPDRDSAEVGLLVEDAWQQRGLGRVLFEKLIALGESRGLRTFVAFVHWDNRRTLQALSRLTTILDRHMEAGVLKVTFTMSGRACHAPDHVADA